MLNEQNIQLTSAELSQIWSAYQNDTMMRCLLRYFLNHVDDDEIRSVLDYALQLAQTHLEQLTAIFEAEGNAVPQGFTDDDVNVTAPRLYSDTFILAYVQQSAKLAMNSYSMSVALAARQDIHAYFSQCMRDVLELHRMANEVLLSKGLYTRSPNIPYQDQVTFADSQQYLRGWWGTQRPLLSVEIANLFDNAQRNALGRATMMGFSQVALSKEVGKYMVRGKEIAAKHVEIFNSALRSDDLQAPMTWDYEVTTSTQAPFSDKLMMFQTTALIAIGMGYYGTAMATSMRRDLAAKYSRLMAEIGKYAEDGANIMIRKGWLEKPPQQADRSALANND
ncbi:DUF3231 family protein [Tuberibacillus sp. Marseille-P3662]|uniref:DUF3231 family protein n=1 Tax=Tuberibacillus sp. Marseille-P3662 TaxID=1965358 RepID=UPI000A1CB881|nr:DUF3231 family protein [Tuberibacillus sp. Marseille-P3662]